MPKISRGPARVGRHPVQQQHRQRVRLLAAGAGRRPDRHRPGRPAAGQLGQQVAGERLERVGVAEPGRLVRGERVHDLLAQARVAAPQPGDQAADVGLPDRAGDRGQPRLDQVLLARLQVDRAALPHHRGDEQEVGLGQAHRVTPSGCGARAEPARPRAAPIAGPTWSSGSNPLGQPGRGDRTGHPPDHAGRLVLGVDRAARLPDHPGRPAPRPCPSRSAPRPAPARPRPRRRPGTARRRPGGSSSPAGPRSGARWSRSPPA